MKEQNNTYYRYLCWTEDNRLQAVKDPYMGAYYNYDASGERNLKLTGATVDVTQNGQLVNIPVLDQQTLYASALVTVNDKGYTKHYFEEGKRICSKIGNGGLQEVQSLVDEFVLSYEDQQVYVKDGIVKTFDKCMGITPKIKTQNLYEDIIKKYEGQVNSDEPVFYYHSDHLGSASYITEDNGYETQHLVYLPFGEDWVDLKYNTTQFETPYKFNGKEKDEETGYNYYGARYYFDYLSIFLSTDPMSDKYPNLSSYTYCANNPVVFIDPDGRFKTKFGAIFYKFFNGGEIGWSQDRNEYFVGKDVNLIGPGVGVAYERKFGSNIGSNIRSNILSGIKGLGNSIKNAFSKLENLLPIGKGEKSNGSGYVESTKNYNGGSGPGTHILLNNLDSKDGNIYTNIDQLIAAMSGVRGEQANTILKGISNFVSAFSSGYNAAEAIQNTVNENKDNGDTTLYEWGKKDFNGSNDAIPHVVKKDKDSIKQFNKTHKTQPD